MATTRPGTRFFEPGALRFLRELAKNNNRPWFQANKARYEKDVQGPAVRFIAEMGPRLGRISPHLTWEARLFGGSLGRIYRDTRFSKDKSPYRTRLGIHFGHDAARGDEHLPGYFLHIAPGESSVSAGIWRPSPGALQKIRDSIVASPGTWGRVLPKGVTLDGESYVRVPTGYDPAHRYAADLRRKDFYAWLPFADAEVAAPSFGPSFEAACRRLGPLNRWLSAAIGVPW
jgi:uncharacterized protein (TIGR02453 family)